MRSKASDQTPFHIFIDVRSFLETVCIRNGEIQHLSWHQQRVNATLKRFYPAHQHTWTLAKCIQKPSDIVSGLVRCRIIYDAHHFDIHFDPYEARQVSTLKMVEIPADFTYGYKFADRNLIEECFEKRGKEDDILMIKNGWITDTSIANIAFKKNERWYTPSLPLLAGTTWKRLVSAGLLIPRPIHHSEIANYDGFKSFNAMIDIRNSDLLPVKNIVS